MTSHGASHRGLIVVESRSRSTDSLNDWMKPGISLRVQPRPRSAANYVRQKVSDVQKVLGICESPQLASAPKADPEREAESQCSQQDVQASGDRLAMTAAWLAPMPGIV